jgi:hypothetical protein
MSARGGCLTLFGGCLTKLVLLAAGAVVLGYAGIVVLNPWALHIGKRSTPLLYWNGGGTVLSKDGKTYPVYVRFWPDRPHRHSGGRREGKIKTADLTGRGWLCLAPGSVERMDFSGTMYGGYRSTDGALISFRLLEWRKPFAITYERRGYFDLAGEFHGPDLVLDTANEQGSPFKSGTFIDHATATLHWADYDEFESACLGGRSGR